MVSQGTSTMVDGRFRAPSALALKKKARLTLVGRLTELDQEIADLERTVIAYERAKAERRLAEINELERTSSTLAQEPA